MFIGFTLTSSTSQYELSSISFADPNPTLVETIRDVPAVRDISWCEESEYITVTTDTVVTCVSAY